MPALEAMHVRKLRGVESHCLATLRLQPDDITRDARPAQIGQSAVELMTS